MEILDILQNYVEPLLALYEYWQLYGPWDLSRRSTVGSVSPKYDGIRSFSIWWILTSMILFLKGDFRCAPGSTRQLVDLWIDILHRDQEVGDLQVCYVLSSSNRRVFSLEKLTLYRYRDADIASWWRDDNGYDGETPVSCLIGFFLLRKKVHDAFHHFHHGCIFGGRRSLFSVG